MGFRENLKAELSYKNMLVKELSALSGVNKRTIDNYLRGNGSVPSVETAVSIARVLGVSVEYLVTGRDSRRGKTLAALAPNQRLILESLEQLDPGDNKIVLDLIKSLRERNHKPR
jgi:transcriptional regulator with XRE-family HTH domain